MNFRVGQMVRIRDSAVDLHDQNVPCRGMPTRIASPLRLSPFRSVMVHELEVHVGGLPVLAEPCALEPYHEPGDYQTLDELIRGVVPAGKADA